MMPRRRALPSPEMSQPPERPETRDLPDNVRRLVDEIENEIGDDGFADAIAPGLTLPPTSGHAADAPGENGRIEAAVAQILTEIGEDPTREGLVGTPDRVHRMYLELTAGYHVDPERLINKAVFEVDYSEMVVVKDIPFYSLCEHHLLPFFGAAHVAYVPEGRVIGLSKIPRIVEMYARRLQVQERMTQQVADFLMERLQPSGVGVVLEATHLCAAMRGVRKPGTTMTTAAVLGPVPAQRQDPQRVLRPPRPAGTGRVAAARRAYNRRHDRPSAQGADRQARPRRPRPGRQGARPRPPRRGVRGRLHGLRQTPEMIVTAALQEDVDVVGLSILSGAHMTLVPRVTAQLKDKGLDDVLVTVGGIIPDDDIEPLKAAGVAEVFGPGTTIREVADYIRANARTLD